MNTRIKSVRKCDRIKLSQDAFGKRLGVTGVAVSRIESGERNPSEQIIRSICREFNVDEHWLRTGEGEMFREVSRADALSAFFGDLLSGEPDFRRRFIDVLSRFSPDDWKAIELLYTKAVALMDEVRAEENKKADL